MKLRALVCLLLLANLAFFAWTQGWLDAVVGVRAQAGREPERLARQFQPESVRILPPDEAASAMTVPAALSCLEAGPFTMAEAEQAEAAMQSVLPARNWARSKVDQPGVWLVYLGRFGTADALQKKAEDLRRRQTPFEELQNPPELAPGLSLGRFESRAAADKALEVLTQSGVRAVRVVTLSEPVTLVSLRVERADAALAAKVAALAGTVKGKPLGQAFGPCAK